MVKKLVGAAALALCVAGAGIAADEDNLINVPGAVWNLYNTGGTFATMTPIRDKDVKGGRGVRVTVTSKGTNPYDAGVQTPITKAVHKGDHIWFVFYARAPQATADHPLKVPAMVQLSAAPYTADIQGEVDLGPTWDVQHVDGHATADYPAGSLLGTLQVAGEKGVIELGPAIISDLGPNG